MCAPRAHLRRVRRRFARRATRTPPPCASPRAADRLRVRRQPRSTPEVALEASPPPPRAARRPRRARPRARGVPRTARRDARTPSRSPPRSARRRPRPPPASVSLARFRVRNRPKPRQTPRRPPRARFRRRVPPNRDVSSRSVSSRRWCVCCSSRTARICARSSSSFASHLDTRSATSRTSPPLATPPRGNVPLSPPILPHTRSRGTLREPGRLLRQPSFGVSNRVEDIRDGGVDARGEAILGGEQFRIRRALVRLGPRAELCVEDAHVQGGGGSVA